MTFFYDMNKKLAELAKAPEQLNEGAQPAVAEGQLDELSPALLARTRDAASKKAAAYGNRAEYVKSLPHQQSLAPERQGQIDLYTQAQNHYVGLANKAAGHKNKMADTLTARQLKADLPARMKNMNKSAGSVAEGQLDELSPRTLTSYAGKARGQANWAGGVAKGLDRSAHGKEDQSHYNSNVIDPKVKYNKEADPYAKLSQKRFAGAFKADTKAGNTTRTRPEPYDWQNKGGYGDATNPAIKEQDTTEGSTGDYSARKARAGKDIGRPGKAFAKIARGAAERYGSKERGEKVAGAVLSKLRKAHPQEGLEEGSLEEYGDTAKGQKMLGKVRNRALKNMMKEPVRDMPSRAVYNKNAQSLDRADARAKWNPGVREPMYKYYNQKSNKGMAQDDMEEGKGDGNLANNYPPYGEVTRGDVIAGRLGKDQMGGKAKKTNEASKVKPFSHDDYDEFGVRHSSSFNQPPRAKKGVKPDFLDLDRDGNKTEPMKQAARQAKKGPVDEVKLADLPVRQVKGRAYGAQPEEFDQDDEDQDAAPKKLGRKAVGAGKGKKIGMKIPGKSKLLQKGAIREDDIDIQDQGEYGMEGDAAKDDIHTLVRDARALEKILGDSEDLPEWVQAKLTKAKGMISAVSDYMQTQHERAGEQGMEVELDEKAVSVAQRRAAGIAHAAQKGEIPKSKLRGASKEMAKMSKKELHKFAATKEKDLPQKKGKEEVEETTTSGSVATAPAAAPKKSKGMQFGKGIYDSMNRDLEAMIAESMSINISTSTEGSPSVSVSATDDDAAKLAQMLRAAGIGTGMEQQGQHACPTCGQEPCGCAEQVDENQPDWPTNTETSDDALQYSGGLNKPKTTVAGDGQTTVPVTAVQVREAPASNLDQIIDRYPQAVADFKQSGAMDRGLRDALYDYYFQRGDIRGDDDPHEFLAQKLQDVLGVDESQHMAEAKCMECGMYEGSCECDKDMDESIQRMRDLAGIKEAKPDFLDIKKKAAQNKEKQDDEKVEESILNMRRLWQEYKG